MGDPESRSQSGSRRSSRLLGSFTGLSNPETGSNLFGLRRSPRLLAKSANTMSQSTHMASPKLGRIVYPKRCKPCKPRKPKPLPFWYCDGSTFVNRSFLEIGKVLRGRREADVCVFRTAYAYHHSTSDRWDNIIEKRSVVVSGTEYCTCNGRSHGIMWVGVHGGVDSICVVFLNEEPEMKRIRDELGDMFITYFRMYLLSEMEDIADSPDYADKIAGKPFAVVSVPGLGSTSVNEESDHEVTAAVPNPQKAIALLEKEMVRDGCFTNDETEKIAISSFQCLFDEKLKAEEILVCSFYEEEDDDYKWEYLTTSKIDKHLSIINETEESSSNR